MSAVNEWAATEDDLKGGGGDFPARPRGKYTAKITKAETSTDVNKLLFLKLQLTISHGKEKGGKAFDNYLVLSAKGNGFQRARRNSLYKAIGLEAGSMPPGVPGGPSVKLLEGVYVDFSIEHEFNEVPGEQYSLNTSKSKSQAWVTDGWEQKLNSDGHLVVDGEVVKPKERVTFYEMSDDFAGLSESESDEDSSADEEGWGN